MDELEGEKPKVLSDYHVPDIVSQDFNNKTLFFVSNDVFECKVTIPPQLIVDDVVSALRSFVNSHLYKSRQYSESAIRRHVNSIEMFFDVVGTRDYISTAIGYDFLNKIKSTELSDSTGFHLMNSLKSLLNSSIHVDTIQAGIVSNEKAVKVRQVLINLPKVQRPKGNKSPSLEIYFNSPYNNMQLQSAMRVWCSRFLLEWAFIRHEFKKRMPKAHTKIVKRMYDEAMNGAFKATNTDESISNIISSRSKDRDDLSEYNFIPYQFALSFNHPFLLDHLLLTNYGARQGNLRNPNGLYEDDSLMVFRNKTKKSDVISLISSWIEGGKLKSSRKNVKFTRSSQSAFLIAPSHEEIIVMGWLLASDDGQRQQKSNVTGAKLSDLQEFCHRGMPVIKPSFFKGRSLRTAGSAITKNSKHDVLSALSIMKNGIEYGYKNGAYGNKIIELESDMMLVPNVPDQFLKYHRWRIYGHGIKNSLSQRHMLKCCSSTKVDIEPVNFMLNHCLTSISKKQSSAPSANQFVIPLNYIAETSECAYKNLTEINIPTVSNDMSINNKQVDADTVNMEALARNHTPKVQNDTYFNRSEDKVKLQRESRFARLVGDEMVIMALNLAQEKLKVTRSLSLIECEKMLGIKSQSKGKITNEINSVYEQAEMKDYLVDSTGLIEKDGKIVVLKNPFVAQLITSFIDHIDRTIGEIINSNYIYGRNLIAHRMFLKAILVEHFDDTLIEKGKQEYGRYEFPFPKYKGV